MRWLLSHQAGLPIVDGPLTFEEACAWHPVIRALEAQKPLWRPGTEHVYHQESDEPVGVKQPRPSNRRPGRARDHSRARLPGARLDWVPAILRESLARGMT